MAEAVKHGLIADAAYFAWMEREADALLRRDEAALTRLVRRSVEIKAEVVSGDERETGRGRSSTRGTPWRTRWNARRPTASRTARRWRSGWWPSARSPRRSAWRRPGLAARVAGLLGRLGLPVRLAQPIAAERLVEAMGSDKKNRGRGCVRAATALGAMDSGDGGPGRRPSPRSAKALEAIA